MSSRAALVDGIDSTDVGDHPNLDPGATPRHPQVGAGGGGRDGGAVAEGAPAHGDRRPARERLARLGPPGAAVAVLLGASLPHLGTRPIWLDEAYTVGATHDLLATWRGSGGTQGLYYLLMWPVTALSTDQAWVRAPSALFAAAAVVVVHEIGRRIGGRRAAASGALAFAAAWGLARYAVEARSYTLTILLVTLSWLGLVAAVQASPDGPGGGAGSAAGRRWWRLYVIATLLMPLAHGLAGLQFAGHVAAFALAPGRRRWLRACAPVGLGLLAEMALLFSVGAGDVGSWVDPLSWDQLHSMFHLLFGYGVAGALVVAVAGTGAAVAVAGLVRQVRRRPAPERSPSRLAAWAAVTPVLWLLVMPACVLALSVVRPYGEHRYLLPSLPAVGLLVGLALARIPRRGWSVAAAVAMVAVLLVDHDRVTRGGQEDWPGLVDNIAARADDGDRLLGPAKYRPPVDYWWVHGADAADGPRPELAPLSPTNPLGERRRFYDTMTPRSMRDRLLADTGTTVWYVDRSQAGLDRIDRLRTDPDVLAAYIPLPTVEFAGHLYLVRFEPRNPNPTDPTKL